MALIELIPATSEQAPILANLLQLYAHDFSEFHDIDLEQDGRFEYRDLPLYWREPRRKPFLVKLDGRLAGFVLVKRGSEVSGDETVWDMVEFFVVRRYRRRGVGTAITHEVWRALPGRWEVRVMPATGRLTIFGGVPFGGLPAKSSAWTGLRRTAKSGTSSHSKPRPEA